MAVADAEQWWIPEVKIANYYFQKNISDNINFMNTTRRDSVSDMEFSDEISKQYVSMDGSFEISVENDIIQSICCRYKFIVVKNNLIGCKFSQLVDELKSRFSISDVEFKKDNLIIYENGDIQRDIDIEKFSIFISVNEAGIIQSVSAY
jgi:hypothetical protein